MGKNNKKSGQPQLGRTIIKDRFRGKNRNGSGKEKNYLHTTELNDGYDWGRLNLQSVTEQSNLEDFLSTAELAGTEFTAEKLNVKFVDPAGSIGILSSDEKQKVHEAQQKHRELLQIPRRPAWNERTTGEELEIMEKDSFLQWRKLLAKLQEEEHIVMTPFEKNLDFWRQLWRVIERSDIIVQIVDGRNPLLFRCSDLESYVSEVNKSKVNLLLINKADYLTQNQREKWADYFSKQGVKIAFWSALEETNRQNEKEKEEEEDEEDSEPDFNVSDDENSVDTDTLKTLTLKSDSAAEDTNICDSPNGIDTSETVTHSDLSKSSSDNSDTKLNTVIQSQNSEKSDIHSKDNVKDLYKQDNQVPETNKVASNDDSPKHLVENSANILCGEELLDLFKSLHSGPFHTDDVLTVGMVGYPNVGKSSTINAILKTKKVPVSATPGRTKHFQTLFVEPSLMLCDCPGLVFPSFVSTKAELVINGILPVDQMRDHLAPVNLICERIPRHILEVVYGINIRKPPEGDDPDRRPNAYELLNAYGAMRGYMTSRGAPDGPRSSRYIIKDYINGKLLYCHAPPGIKSSEFQEMQTIKKSQVTKTIPKPQAQKDTSSKTQTQSSLIDKEFFAKMYPASHVKGVKCIRVAGRPDLSSPYSSQQSLNMAGEKPWRHHHNKNKKEKLRRVYAHLDNHDYY